MRLPSIQHLFGQARQAFERFPLMIVAAVVAAVCGMVAVGEADREVWVKALVTAQLGLPLFFALGVAGEARAWPRMVRVAAAAAGVVVLVAYYFTLPDWIRPGVVTRFVQFNVALHLLVAFSPFARPGRQNGFWQYNKSLFLRFLVSALYSAVVFLGLIVALLALDKLLGLRIDDDVYPRLWVFVAFVFNTWVFIGGVPRDIPGLENDHDYPRGLRVFAQYILLPLVVIYLTILTIYFFKVVITTEWPSGWIGYLVSSVAVVGILALLLVWPVAGRDENRWVATYTRWFFTFMIPAIVMLLLAIYKRIDQYGITENRYFLAVLAVWLAAVAVYFIAARNKSIKAIPISLCVIALATSFGPWGAYTVARTSQTQRLEGLMTANGILDAGTIGKAAGEVSMEDRREISSVVLYLVKHHGTGPLEPWMEPAQLATLDSLKAVASPRYGDDQDVTRAIVSEMGIEYVAPWVGTPSEGGRFNYTIDGSDTVFDIGGADTMVRLQSLGYARAIAGGFTLAWQAPTGVVLSDGDGMVLVAPVDSLIASIERNPYQDVNAMPARVMRVAADNERARLVVYFQHLNGTTRDGVRTINYVSADCFITLK